MLRCKNKSLFKQELIACVYIGGGFVVKTEAEAITECSCENQPNTGMLYSVHICVWWFSLSSTFCILLPHFCTFQDSRTLFYTRGICRYYLLISINFCQPPYNRMQHRIKSVIIRDISSTLRCWGARINTFTHFLVIHFFCFDFLIAVKFCVYCGSPSIRLLLSVSSSNRPCNGSGLKSRVTFAF